MSRLNLCIVCLMLMLVATVSPSRAQQADTTARFMINFPVSVTTLDWQYGENRYALAELNRFFSNVDLQNIDSIRITGSTSPEGNKQINTTYANLRANSMRDCFVSNYGCSPTQITVSAQWNTWAEMVKLVSSDPDIPKKSEVMIMLNAWHVPYSERLKLMAELEYTDSYQYIKEKTFPVLRNVHAVVIFYRLKHNQKPFVVHDIKSEYDKLPAYITKKYDLLSAVVLPADLPLIDTTLVGNRSAVDTMVQHKDTLRILTPADMTPPNSPKSATTKGKKPLFALKTNLLYDAATLINVSIEIPIGKHWSIAAEAIFPWWMSEKNQYCLQIFNANLEGKYWFAPQNNQKLGKFAVMTGWFIGAYAGAGLYDIEYQKKGYRGDFSLSTGLTGGYAHSIGKHLRMEYSVGAGYMQTSYTRYEARYLNLDQSWKLYNQERSLLRWIGPTKAEISLVWMLNRTINSNK